MRTWLPVSLTVLALMAVTWGIFAQSTDTAAAGARGFYVANSVALADEAAPKARSLTIFADQRAYDISVAGSGIVIFDAKQQQVVLLDKKRKVKTSIAVTALEAAREQFRTWCLKQADPVLRFCGRPQFDIQKTDQRVEFLAEELEYLMDTTSGETQEAAKLYREFSDAMVGLAVVNQSSPVPPLARLVVNRELAKDGLLPVSVGVKMKARTTGDPALHIRTHHTIGWQLRANDQKLLSDINTYERTFRRVNLNEFLGRNIQTLSAQTSAQTSVN